MTVALCLFFADDALSLPVFPVGAVPPVAWQIAVFAARFHLGLALGVITWSQWLAGLRGALT